jgi:hypothetical protein
MNVHTKIQNILSYCGVEYCKDFIYSIGVSSGASRKVAGLIPDGVIGIFYGPNTLGSNEPL